MNARKQRNPIHRIPKYYAEPGVGVKKNSTEVHPIWTLGHGDFGPEQKRAAFDSDGDFLTQVTISQLPPARDGDDSEPVT
jgi:hypothetical protein